MEKIQSALAKARAERETTARGATPAPMPSEVPVSNCDADSVDAAWKALPEMSISADLMTRNRIVAFEGGRDAMVIDMLRTRTLQQMRDNGWRRLAITSPTAACGKSTIALNLALSLQRQSQMRTVLMELDLRRPSMARLTGIKENISFGHVLEGTRDFRDNALRYGNNLAISSNPKPWRDSAELLSGSNVQAALTAIETEFAPDVMLFDMPPMLEIDDMMAFARNVDCVLLVAGAEASTIKEIDMCETELATQTNVMGVILNKCRYMGAEYGYGYYG
ncbi:CpsD/CapB family tyrosine-protein kinase (plasmid) [Pseudorhodobacter turbinis]|uniref:CpsD/CapB family tyrosine-protein kinase n=1 Tax=Pseudorhodobacter turbinis TaxID=2500533 RepID=A0A4P8EM49_9RHOB|nr:CpsD/CapB family tyrosine-protein kinase [Pseudorhodobacter turbinis]QCO58109.1 CpsD/CapB family tyrosine-protein kinase [Pseudorhodobacter turbinis]